MKNEPLSPELQATLDVLTEYHRSQFASFQDRQRRREELKNYDERYNLPRLLHAMRDGNVPRGAPYEWNLSERIAEAVGRPPHNGYVFVPVEGRRDLTTAVAGAGGFLVSTDVAPGQTFTHFLDQFFPFERLGITRISLQRPATIPTIAGTVATTWLLNEGSTISEDQFTFAVSSTTPKSVGAYCELSDRFLKQTSTFAQAFVMQALARAISAELSRKILTGSGASGQPLGIFNTPGVGSLAGGSANYAKVLDAIETVEVASALLTPASAGFVMPANIAKLLRTRERATGSGTIMLGNDVSGYPGIVTEGTSPNTICFADWSQLALLEYSILEIASDPYGANSALFKAGIVGIRCLWTIDTVLLNPSSFVVTGAVS